MTAIVTAVDRAEGTITASSAETFAAIQDAILADAAERGGRVEHFTAALAGVLAERYAEGTLADIRFSDASPLDGYEYSIRGGPAVFYAHPAFLRPRSVPITPAVVVTLCTLGAFEWLRHRKAAVAAAEASGDYAPLLAEFVAWLRALLGAWRRAGA